MSPGLSVDASLVSADGWFLVRRLTDDQHPHVWTREPVAAFTVGRRRRGEGAELVAVMADGTVSPLRQAEEGRDGADFHARADTFMPCECDLPVLSLTDPSWCGYCTGVRHG